MGDSPVNPLVVVGVCSSVAFSGLFYYLYQEKKKELKKLKEIPIFQPDAHLLKVLNASQFKRLKYAAVEGVVQADGESLQSSFVPKCHGVIQKVVEEEQSKHWSFVSRTWESRIFNRKETSNSVPFGLVQAGSYTPSVSVKVQNPLEASGCYMESVYFNVRRPQVGLVDTVVQSLRGEKPVATVQREQMLRVGSSLTGFGELVLEGGQVMKLKPPEDGRSYILVPSDYSSFIDRHEASASMWKMLTAFSGLSGAALVAAVVYKAFGKVDDRSR